MIKVRTVHAAGVIGVVAPGSPCDPLRFNIGMEELRSRGFECRCPLDPTAQYGKHDYGFASAAPESRKSALEGLAAAGDVDAIISARGAYGTLEILPLLDFDRLAQAGKCIVGCSDVTALLVAVLKMSGLVSVHGPTVSGDFARAKDSLDARQNIEELLLLLSDPGFRLTAKCESLRSGSAAGTVLAGNLTMLVSLLGTPWDIDYRGSILVLEDIGEAPYRVHRHLMQLRLAGKFESLAALVFGRFSRCEVAHGPTVEEVIRRSVGDILHGTSFPVLFGFPFGHGGRSHPLALGCRAEVEGDSFYVRESPLSEQGGETL